jgi:uncharacterized membrane protein YdbT with pleckstrin-like domain
MLKVRPAGGIGSRRRLPSCSVALVDLMPGEKLIWAGHPTWRATISTIVWGVLVGLGVLVLGVLVDKVGGGSRWTMYGVLGLILIAGGTIAYSWIARRFTEYTITDKRLNVRWGVLSKQETTTTIDRVQNMTITQTLIDRVLNTGTIDFDTASSTSDERFRFHGVNEPGELRQKVNAVRIGTEAPGAPTGGI